MLRIGVDFHSFDGKFQGIRSHVIGLYAEMVALCPDWHFVFFLEQVDKLRLLQGFDRPNVTLVRMPHANPFVRLAWQLPRMRRVHRIDLLHTQGVIPLVPARGNAVTIHDVLFEPYPQYFTPFFVWRSRWLFKRSARLADLVLTVSDYSRREIARCYGIPAASIGTLLNAVDPTIFFPGDADADLVRARGLEPGKYVLTVGRIDPRKDHVTLLRALTQLGPDAPSLAIVGQKDFGFGAFDQEMARMPSGNRVTVLSDVTDRELPALYRHAHLFVYPSLAEGFGMPPLEAMASGVPVIAADSTALPDVVGDAGVLVAPGDAQALASEMQRVLGSGELRERLIKKGLERSKSFRWRAAAEELRRRFLSYRGRG